MARHQDPVTDEEVETLRRELEEQREELRRALAEDLGGDPEDYSAEAFLSDRVDEPAANGDD